MVNGENPHVDFDFYVDTDRALHEALPDVHLKCYTASEIHHMTTLSGLTHEEVLRELKDAGLGSLPGGGAEIFADRVRRLVAPGQGASRHLVPRRTTPRTALGIPTHCTMLYGHVETYEERVDHLLRLRDQQDRTGGFLAFIPLAFHPENTVFERRGWRHTTGADDLKMLAVSRLMLDNVPNIKAYWIMMGMPLAAVALHFGANDVQGTVVREQIFHAAGRAHRDRAEGRRARPLRARGRAHPGAARHALQRAAPVVTLEQTIPAMPVRDMPTAVAFYRDRLGFEVLHHDGGFAVLGRGEAVVHLWEASDESWRERATRATSPSAPAPSRSSRAPRAAGSSSTGVDELYDELRAEDVLHPGLARTASTTRISARASSRRSTTDGNLVTFFELGAP